ncbi:axonemal dynein light chain [Pelagophyceae sp. CCMP2097]|nr:axonemal dynein light chain [Pelagophyceae sp. CCMP2097]
MRRRAPRLAVHDLQKHLDDRLQHEQAKAQGICPVRGGIYAETFDKLIVQVEDESPELGLIVSRVRNQLKMTLGCFHELHRSGTSEAIASDATVAELSDRHDALEAEILRKKLAVAALGQEMRRIELAASHARAVDELLMRKQLEALQQSSTILRGAKQPPRQAQGSKGGLVERERLR